MKASEAALSLPLVSKERFSRALRGYDPDEVDAALEARDARLARLEREAQRLAERVVEREKRLQDALKRPMAAAVSKGVEEIYGQARRQATRIRMKALEDAVQMADRVTELSGLRDASPQASPAVCVPWPTVSVVGELVPKAAAPAMRPAMSGCVPSTPESIMATSAPVPLDRSQACGAPS